MQLSNFSNPSSWLIELFGGGRGNTRVTSKSALQTAPFWYGINRISGNIGTMNLDCRKKQGDGSEVDKKHVGYRLLRKRPNPYQSPCVFKQLIMQHAIVWGNGRAYIHRAGMNSELIPMMPDRCATMLVDGRKWHIYKPYRDERIDLVADMETDPKGTIVIADEDCLHIQGFGNGITGYSLFEMARKSLEISIAADKRASRQMTKGFAGKVMLEAPENSRAFRDEAQAKEFLENFQKKHGADGAADEVGLLRGGIKANVLQMSNKDAEFIQSRIFQRQEAALWLQLEGILGDDTSQSYNTEEQKSLAYLKHCLNTWMKRWEEECDAKILTNRQFFGDTHYFRFNSASLLRGDMATTMETLSKGITARIFSPNDARRKLDENPYPGGDTYENPAVSPGTAGQTQESEPEAEDESTPNAAMIDRLEHLMGVESKRVNKFLSRGDSFEKIETWYAGWAETLGDAIANLGGSREIATRHCQGNIKYLKTGRSNFDLAGTAQLLAQEIEDEK